MDSNIFLFWGLVGFVSFFYAFTKNNWQLTLFCFISAAIFLFLGNAAFSLTTNFVVAANATNDPTLYRVPMVDESTGWFFYGMSVISIVFGIAQIFSLSPTAQEKIKTWVGIK